jgi:hypothetical protein
MMCWIFKQVGLFAGAGFIGGRDYERGKKAEEIVTSADVPRETVEFIPSKPRGSSQQEITDEMMMKSIEAFRARRGAGKVLMERIGSE